MQRTKLLLINPAVLLGCIYFQVAIAQVPVTVVDAGAGESQSVTQQTQSNNQNEIMVNMYLQLESLQAEIQNLRGLVEVQSNLIRRMQMEQRDRYLDTDSRIGELYNQVQAFHGGQAIPSQPSQLPEGQLSEENPAIQVGTVPNISEIAPGTPSIITPFSTQAPVVTNVPQNEQALYRQALNLLLEDEAYQDSITLFQQYIDVYPAGRYLTNALYWQGAAFELTGSYNQAIVVLQRLINEFPEDPKAPTALLRLGTVYREMGNTGQAAVTWQQISQAYPDSTSEIEIASEYLVEIGN
ncbi:MAG: tol-pal system protein YbgF [Gammaproteobacteria bacterium]|nr:tol-pal system protein YbgF [Gammaproteobacteria bacterium]